MEKGKKEQMHIFKRHEMKDRRYMKTWQFGLYFTSLETRSSWAPRKIQGMKRKKGNVSESKTTEGISSTKTNRFMPTEESQQHNWQRPLSF